jgi:ribosomal protein S18 acetylase RimI-like enzyme
LLQSSLLADRRQAICPEEMIALNEIERRAAAWRRAGLEAVCDVVEPWEHGTIFRATRYPSYYDYNVVWVEGDPGLSADELVAVADDALGDFEHRRLDFERAEAGDAVRADLEAARWKATRLLWMRHAEALPPGTDIEVDEVDYDSVLAMRIAWHREDFPDLDSRDYIENAREVAMTRNLRVLAAVEGGEPVGFAQLERIGAAAEVTQVYVRPERRDGGRGTAITRAAIEAAGDVDDLWIAADDEGRPKELYARLGFRPAWTSMEFIRVPGVAGFTG